MKTLRLVFLLLTCAAVTFAASDDSKSPASNPAPIAEHDRLVQELMAERGKLVEARKELQAKTKKAKKERDAQALKKAQDDIAALEKDFTTRNADLVRQIKAKEDEKKGPRPGTGKPTG
jgi:hypothetical protein